MYTMVLCSFLYAAEVTLSGTVKDGEGKPLEGVTVTLAKIDSLKAKSTADGAFTLTNVTSVLLPKDLKASHGFTFKNNAIVFTNTSEKVSGTVSLYSINGRLITSVTLDNLSTGKQLLVLPGLSSGTYLLAGNVNGVSFTRSLMCSGNDRLRSTTSMAEGASLTLRKTAAAAVVDTLIAFKEGYDTTRLPVDSYSRDNINMVLTVPNAKPIVYMTKDISAAGLMAVYKAINRQLPGKVLVKIHTGEPNGKYFLKPELIKDVVVLVNGTIGETCVAYGGQRASAAPSLQVAKDHGFTDIAEVDILDKDGEITLPVTGGTHLKENYVGKNLGNYNSCLVISHFKGHSMAGLGGAIKNISIGFATPPGKAWIHTSGSSKKTSDWMSSFMKAGGADTKFTESMAEAAKSVVDKFDGNMIFINVGKDLTLECDCEPGSQHAATDPDIGILGSLDPVAVDQACTDLVAKTGDLWKQRIDKLKGAHQMEHGEAIGLGSRDYELKVID